MRIGSLFAGIGGLELGLEWAGLGHTVWQVEREPYCRRVLAQHWPDAERFEDVCTVGAANLAPVDLICGGFPCQDISGAGKGAGLAGSRSGLWYEYLRIVGEMRPEWVVVENVASGAHRWVDAVRSDLERAGYETLPIPLSARDVGAPHLRERVFIVAHAHARRESASRFHGEASRVPRAESYSPAWPAPPDICGVDDGIPGRVDRLQALGNAVVPQCAEVIGWIIREASGAV